LNATFATERDRLLADLLASAEGREIEVRPETPEDRSELVVFDEPGMGPGPRREFAEDPSTLLEPIERGVAAEKKE
jgi:hypothetical protein